MASLQEMYSASVQQCSSDYAIKDRQNADWFEAHLPLLEAVIAAEMKALTNYKSSPSQHNLQTLKVSRSEAQRLARRCANDHWVKLSENI